MAKSKQVLALASLHVGQKRPVSPRQSRQNQNMAAAGHAWADLPTTERSRWQLLANQMTHDTGLRTPAGLKQKRPMNAFQCFASLNVTLLASGNTINTIAPDAPARPAALPPVLLTATATYAAASDSAPPASPGTLAFTLSLTLPQYADTLQIYAAAPLLAGQYPAGRKPVIIATLPAPATGLHDLAAAYDARFGPLLPGQQVTLTLVAVSPQGFKGTPLTLAADVLVPAQPAQRHTDAPPALKAA